MEFKQNLKKYQEIINNELEKYLRKENCPEKILNNSMEYSLMAGGKRLRPILVLATYELFRQDIEEAMPFAIAIEMVHNFSLIHDDLPEIDNDDFRHGKPTNHKQFNHPTALLAGDSLFNQAYIVMSKDLAKSATQNKIRIFGEFSNAVDRMIAGEYLDTELEGQQISHQMLQYIHENKTGELLKLSIRMGAILADASENDIERLSKFADKIGLAFQIKDDILSEEGNPDVTGKPVGNDKEHNKCTYVSVFGIEGAKKELTKLIAKYNVDMFAIGNGTASRESEQFVSDLIAEIKEKYNKDLVYVIVSEAGASVYSASKLATEEYPDINVSLRGAISIARRLQDPLAELVKIDPKAIGVGQYQHDVNQKNLEQSLTGVVEDAVNSVGVDINTATPSLLAYVSGINNGIAKNIVKYREENGKLKERKELLKVPKLGKVAYEQCAGFIRVPDGKNPLEITGVHPESYSVAENLLSRIGYKLNDLTNKEKFVEIKSELAELNNSKNIKELAAELNVGEPTLQDIINELMKPGRDPREEMPKPILRADVLKFEDLRDGMILTGTVRNVTDFGAFVDVGVKHDGLVHISEMSENYVKNPSDVVSVGDVVKVQVIGIDQERQKVKLSMKIK